MTNHLLTTGNRTFCWHKWQFKSLEPAGCTRFCMKCGREELVQPTRGKVIQKNISGARNVCGGNLHIDSVLEESRRDVSSLPIEPYEVMEVLRDLDTSTLLDVMSDIEALVRLRRAKTDTPTTGNETIS